MAFNHRGEVAKHDHREYGFAQVQVSKLGNNASVDALFEGLGDEMQVCLVPSSTNRHACLIELI